MSALKVWDGTQWVWVSQPASYLDNLQDVNAPAPEPGQVMTFDGEAWVPLDPEPGTEPPKVSSIYGYGGTTTNKNTWSPALIDLDYLNADAYVRLNGENGHNLSTPSDSSFDFTKSLDIRLKVFTDHDTSDWQSKGLIERTAVWRVLGAVSGSELRLSFMYTHPSTGVWTAVASADMANVIKSGVPHWVRVAVDLTTGAVNFYTSVDGETWVSVSSGSFGGAISMKTSSSGLVLGARDATLGVINGGVYAAKLYTDGRLAVDFDADVFPDKAIAGVTAVDATGHTWSMNGAATKVHRGKAAWLPGSAGNYFSTLDKNKLAYQDATFETTGSTGSWTGLSKNLLNLNQSTIDTGTGEWTPQGNTTVAASTAQFKVGTKSLAVTAIAAGDAMAATTYDAAQAIPVIPNTVYTFSAYFKSGSVPRNVRLQIRWGTAGGAYISAPLTDSFVDNEVGWTQATFTTRAPSTAYRATLLVGAIGCAAGEVHYVDAISFMETPSANLLSNPDFESDTTLSWTFAGSATGSVDTTQAYTGTRSCKVITAAGSDGIMRTGQGQTACQPNTRYTMSFYVKGTAASGTFTPRIEWWSAQGTGYISATTGTAVSITTEWTRVTATFTSPSDAKFMNADSRISPGVTVYVDAVQLIEGSTANVYTPASATNLFPTPSGESGTPLFNGSFGTGGQRAENPSTIRAYVGTSSTAIWTAAGGTGYMGYSRTIRLTAGSYVVSAYVYVEENGNPDGATGGGNVLFYNTSTNASFSIGTEVPFNQWTRVSKTFTRTTGGDESIGIGFTSASPHRLFVDAIQVEHGSAPTRYTDGSLPGCQWDTTDNLMTTNPHFATDTSGWSYNTSAASGAVARVASGGPGGSDPATYGSFTKPADATTWNYIGKTLPAGARLPANTMLTISFWARHGAGHGANKSVAVSLTDGNGANTSWSGPTITLTSTWQRYSLSAVTNTASNASNVFYMAPGAGAEAKEIHLTGVQMETRPFALPYGQTGVAHQDTSTRMAPWVEGGSTLDTLVATGGNAFLDNNSKYLTWPFEAYPLGAGLTATVSPSTTYTWSAETIYGGGGRMTVRDLATGTELATKVLTRYSEAGYRNSLSFTTGVATTSVRLEFGQQYNYNYAESYFFDKVQLEKSPAATDYTAPFKITGDIDIRVKAALEDWTPSELKRLVNYYTAAGNQRGWFLAIGTAGDLQLYFSTTGTNSLSSSSNTPIPAANGEVKWLRATRAATTGETKFYTSDDGSTWTQLGATATGTAGSIYPASPGAFLVGANELYAGNPHGSIVYAEVRSGISGPVTASFAPGTLNRATIESTVLASKPSGYWRLGETSGTVATDISGNAKHGTYGGGSYTLGATGAVTGDPDKAAYFETGYASVPQQVGPAGSISFWVNTTSWDDDNLQRGIFQSNNSTSTNHAGWLSLFRWTHASGEASAPFYVRLVNDAGVMKEWAPQWRDAVGSTIGWVHLAVTWASGGKLLLYVNGELKQVVSSDIGTYSGDTTHTSSLIGRGHGTFGAKSTIDEFAMYNRVLSPEEIRAQYVASQARLHADDLGRTWSVNTSGDHTAELVDRNAWALTDNQYLSIPSDEVDMKVGVDNAAAVRVQTRATPGNRMYVMSDWGSSAAFPEIGWDFFEENNEVYYRTLRTPSYPPGKAASTTRDGLWHTLSGHREGSSLYGGFDGTLGSVQADVNASYDLTNTRPLTIGYNFSGYKGSNLISWAAVFRRALTSAEHAELAAWDGRVATQPDWLDEAATLLVNADEPGTRASYRAANFVGSHFTGDTPDDADYLYYWSGTPYASQSIRMPATYARAIVPVQPDEPEGVVGALWYDSDDESWTVDVSYIQDNEPTGAEDGSLWLDTDDPAAHTDADHAGLAVVGHTHDYAASTHNHDSQYYTETEVNNLLATKSTGYYFVPPSAGTRQYMRLFTLNGSGASGGADLSALLSGLGDYGNAHRATVLLHAGQRGDNGFVLTAHEWNAPLVTQPVRLFYKQISTYVFEVWAYFASYSLSQGLQVLAASGATVNVDSATASAPSGLTEITIQPAKEWNRIAVINPTGAANTVGNCRFSSIPTVYKRLRIRSSYFQHGTTGNNASLWVRFNNDTTTAHYGVFQYHTTGTWTGTNSSGSSGANYAAYSYFYAGTASVYNVFEMEIANHGLGEVNWLSRNRCHTGAGATYPYRTESVGHWASSAKVTQIDFWTDTAYTWGSGCELVLEGSLEL